MRCDATFPYVHGQPNLVSARKSKTSIRFVLSNRPSSTSCSTTDVLESGGRIERETRLYDPDKDETRSMRSKELSNTIFSDPDLLPLSISEELIERIRAAYQSYPTQTEALYINFGLSDTDARRSAMKLTANYFDAVWLRVQTQNKAPTG